MTYKAKHLHGITENGIRIRTLLQYNMNTNHITIGNTFSNNYKPKQLNKSCTQYLGIICAEQVLSKIFKNVTRMGINNPGYDFICGKGFKVDSKASCKRIIDKKSDHWSFSIKQNKIADYFLCLAFDNREDLNPLYLWLIPSKILNNKKSTTISESKLNKWNEYKLDINKVVECCNIIKGDNK